MGNFTRATNASMNLTLDEFTVIDSESGERIIANDLEDFLMLWQLDSPSSTVGFTRVRAHSGEASQILNLNMGATELIGLKLTTTFTAYGAQPALVSPAFLAMTEAQVGDVLKVTLDSRPIDFLIVGIVTYFPTAYEELNAGYLITNRDTVLEYMNTFSNKSINANEVLLAIEETAMPEVVSEEALSAIPSVSQALEAETVRKNIKADPMALGLRSVTFFGYVLTTLLSLIGFATHFYLSARQKETIYGVLRSIGLSPRQLYMTLVLEQVVLILAGLAIGTGLGVVLNEITLPGLPITFGDRPPTPPFIAQNDWLAVGRIYLTLSIAFFLSLGIATTLLWQTKLHRVLRVGEE